jgi:Carbohydrate-selective porin, OprB family/S-layer homology domain
MVTKNFLLLFGICVSFFQEPSIADDKIYSNELSQETRESKIESVTSVSQLSDVQPTDWAFVALQSLVERYGVIAGYPDNNFRGNLALSRYEFAAGLNSTLKKINELVNSGLADKVREVDLEILQRLQAEFSSELADLNKTLNQTIDNLEPRVAKLEAQRFSPTARLGGQVILGVATSFGGNPPGGCQILPGGNFECGKPQTNTVLTHLTQLQLASSFTGKDILSIGLVTGNTTDDGYGGVGFARSEVFNTNMARLSYEANYDNQVRLESLEYRVLGLDGRVGFIFKPIGFSLSSVLSPNSPFANAGQGAISLFAGLSPIFQIGNLDSGLGFDWFVSDQVRLQFAYGTRNGSDSSQNLFGAEHSALGLQLLYNPTSSFSTGITYVNAYSKNGQLDTGTGSSNADTSGKVEEPAQIHAANVTVQWLLADNVVFSGWGGFAVTDFLRSNAVTLSTTYILSLGLYNPLGRKGDFLGVLVGQPPKLNAGLQILDVDDGSSTHYEFFYRFLVNDNIAITPGFFIVTDPGNISDNNDIFVGAIRTTFRF